MDYRLTKDLQQLIRLILIIGWSRNSLDDVGFRIERPFKQMNYASRPVDSRRRVLFYLLYL